ncbi:MAG: FAD:protein FMN transferase [Candidatus Latescibacteria bacterium]|nr:FAD:protein FMN transferase [Candidatus Latescibacterota bacterium]
MRRVMVTTQPVVQGRSDLEKWLHYLFSRTTIPPIRQSTGLTRFPPPGQSTPLVNVDAEEVSRARYLMGTVCEITASGDDVNRVEAGVTAAFAEIDRLEKVMSTYRDDSEIARLNRTPARQESVCSEDLFSVIEQAQGYAVLTGGTFDITVHPLIEVWGFEKIGGDRPTPEAIFAALTSEGYRLMTVNVKDRTCTFTRDGMGINLGGIGKGYALDKAVDQLRRYGVTSARLNFGGNISTMGRPSDGETWCIRVSHPVKLRERVVDLYLSDRAVSTSANSERFVEIEGKRYGHILNPRTGFPANRQGSVTVVSPSATEADALSTGLFVMSDDQIRLFVQAHQEIGVIVMTPGGNQSEDIRLQTWNVERYLHQK